MAYVSLSEALTVYIIYFDYLLALEPMRFRLNRGDRSSY